MELPAAREEQGATLLPVAPRTSRANKVFPGPTSRTGGNTPRLRRVHKSSPSGSWLGRTNQRRAVRGVCERVQEGVRAAVGYTGALRHPIVTVFLKNLKYIYQLWVLPIRST